MAKAKKKTTKGTKFSFINEVYEGVLGCTEVGRNGAIKLKRADLKAVLENTFEKAAVTAAGGERVRFPIIGVLARRDVKARKSGKGVNPFTGEPMTIKARPESKKPRWSFPKNVKETFSKKKHW